MANRTLVRGQELARQFQGRAVPFDSMAEHLTSVDIIITSTGSQEPIIRARDIRAVLKAVKTGPCSSLTLPCPAISTRTSTASTTFTSTISTTLKK